MAVVALVVALVALAVAVGVALLVLDRRQVVEVTYLDDEGDETG